MKSNILLLVIGCLALSGCSEQSLAVKTAAMVFVTRPKELPPADTKTQIPEHEVWCYRTMGETDCYAHAQDVQPTRLVNVEPQNLYPLTHDAYDDELEGKRQAPATANPVKLNAGDVPVEKKSLFERLTGYKIMKSDN
ncbi:MAG: hypothetical protein WC464_01085 [Bdellovibrionales bacterium]